MLTSDMSKTINITIIVTRMPNINCLKGLLTSLGYESSTNPHEVYVVDELELRSLIGVIEISSLCEKISGEKVRFLIFTKEVIPKDL